VGANNGENRRSLKLKRAEMKAGSMELRERGSQAEDVDVVCIATSWLKGAVLFECASWVPDDANEAEVACGWPWMVRFEEKSARNKRATAMKSVRREKNE
jgi:hypothetical protein